MPRPNPAETIEIVTVNNPRAVVHDDERWFGALSEPFKARQQALPGVREHASTEAH